MNKAPRVPIPNRHKHTSVSEYAHACAMFPDMRPIEVAKVFLGYHGARMSPGMLKRIPKPLSGDYPSTDGLQSSIAIPGQPTQWTTVANNNHSPYELVIQRNGTFAYHMDNGHIYTCDLYPSKDFGYIDEQGTYKHMGMQHFHRIRINPITGCGEVCFFCPLHRLPYTLNPTKELLGAIVRATKDTPNAATSCLISGGTPRPQTRYTWSKRVSAILAKSPVPTTLMMAIPPIRHDCDDEAETLAFIRRIGEQSERGKNSLTRICINLELVHDDEMPPDVLAIVRRIIPSKSMNSWSSRISFLRKVRELLPKHVAMTSLLVAGENLIPREHVVRGARELIRIGIEPVLSPYKSPYSATYPFMKDRPSATPMELIMTYRQVRDAMQEAGMKSSLTVPGDTHNVLVFNE